jgi:hypothetical protein
MAHINIYYDDEGTTCYGPGTTVVTRCTTCDRVEVSGHEDDTRQVDLEAECPACERQRVELENARWEREHGTLGPRDAREDVVLCVRCGRPTGRHVNIKLCDACDHELDACYQQWVEEQARRLEGRA